MGTYLKMWDHIRTLTDEEVSGWIHQITPALGENVDFFGRDIIDIDLLEALRYTQEQIEKGTRR